MNHTAFLFLFGLVIASCNSSGSPEDALDQVQVEPTTTKNLNELSKAYFASGCFWCVEAIYESVKGVEEVVSGYAGGKEPHPTYRRVGSGATGHAEAVEVYYDPEVISFEDLVTVFYSSQDPTTVGQAPDFGRQYRSIIFYTTDEEKIIAERAKHDIASTTGVEVVTEILPLEKFWPAEAYHQDYEKRHPDDRYIRQVSIPRLERFKKKRPELLKE